MLRDQSYIGHRLVIQLCFKVAGSTNSIRANSKSVPLIAKVTILYLGPFLIAKKYMPIVNAPPHHLALKTSSGGTNTISTLSVRAELVTGAATVPKAQIH